MSDFANALINPQTKAAITHLIANPPHAILLYGDEGAGKRYLAHLLAQQIMEPNTAANVHIHTIEPDGHSITIEQIRYIRDIVKLKVPGTARVRRVIIIPDAHYMREEAQNALLKTLEEPPEDTVFIVTAHSKEGLLQTVVSRTTPVPVRPISLKQASEAFSDMASGDITRAYHISNGNPGLMTALLQGDEHPLIEHMNLAKRILASSVYERLCLVEELKDDKPALRHTLYCMKRILHFKLRQSANAKTIKYAKLLLQAEVDSSKNVQPRLILTDLFIKL